MGRVAIGGAAREKTGSVRVTEEEFKYFQAKYGGLGRFLKAKVDEELRKAREREEIR